MRAEHFPRLYSPLPSTPDCVVLGSSDDVRITVMYCHLFGLFLGFEPWKITHASDNFGKLYDFAVELIKRYIVESVINAI